MKVTNLETFANNHIFRPYSPILDEAYKGIVNPIPRNLDTAVYHLEKVPEFREKVIQRLKDIDISFPSYINHHLVDYLRSK